MNSATKVVTEVLAGAGIQVGGSQPWDIRVNDERFYPRVLSQGTLGFGESYMEGWWDCPATDELVARLITSGIKDKIRPSWNLVAGFLSAQLFNLQGVRRAFHVAERHYDLGNDLYQTMLDRRMNYSCGYWRPTSTLDEAQERKLEMICRKIRLEKGMSVLDIGCGWGGFAGYAAEKHGARVVGITVSKEQAEFARARYQGLPVEFRLEDYRRPRERFDRVVSVGMVEHVGFKNYRRFMEVAFESLAPDGLFLLHTIGSNRTSRTGDPWFDKYIFPNGILPSVVHLAQAAEGLFRMEDWHNFGPHYDRTLMAWHENFHRHRDRFQHQYGEMFCRMWSHYLLLSAGGFRSRMFQLWQIVFSPQESVIHYERPVID